VPPPAEPGGSPTFDVTPEMRAAALEIRPNDSRKAREIITGHRVSSERDGCLRPVDPPPPPSPVEEEVESRLRYEWKVEALGLAPIQVVLNELRFQIDRTFQRPDLDHRGKQEIAINLIANAWRQDGLDPKLALFVRGLICASAVLALAPPKECRNALRWFEQHGASGWTRDFLLRRMIKDKPTRRRLIDLTRHLTERQAAQVLPLSARTIGRARLENANMEIETPTPTMVERLTALEALVPRVEELERQVGVLPPERVEQEVERLLDEVLD
jgi:hypothetical protein